LPGFEAKALAIIPTDDDSFTVTKSDKIVKVIRLKGRETFSDKLARLENF